MSNSDPESPCERACLVSSVEDPTRTLQTWKTRIKGTKRNASFRCCAYRRTDNTFKMCIYCHLSAVRSYTLFLLSQAKLSVIFLLLLFLLLPFPPLSASRMCNLTWDGVISPPPSLRLVKPFGDCLVTLGVPPSGSFCQIRRPC